MAPRVFCVDETWWKPTQKNFTQKPQTIWNIEMLKFLIQSEKTWMSPAPLFVYRVHESFCLGINHRTLNSNFLLQD